MAEARMVDKKLSTDETMLLTDEFKRVKGKVGRFRVKEEKNNCRKSWCYWTNTSFETAIFSYKQSNSTRDLWDW
jgi:hypothetical protein